MAAPQPTSADDAPLHPEDLELVREALAGRPAALERLMVRMRCVPRMLAAKNSRMGAPLSSEDLEDLTQETLIAIWERLGAFAGRARLETWVYRFCHHLLGNRLRKRARRPLAVDAVPDPPAAPEAPAALRYEALYRALDRLGPPEADVVRMKHLEQLTFQEIGDRLGISPNTAKTRYYRGLARLKAMLGEEGGRP